MKKIFTIGTALLIFLQSVNIHFNDLVEMDKLFEHYQFHSDEYGDNFIVFLSKHYGKLKASHSEKHQEEQQEHEQLPFQHQSQCSQLMAFVVEPEPFFQSNSEIPLDITSNFHYQISYSPIWGDGPFQPPKQA
ncbi:hypothetical protein [Flagellimonas baculiformis]|uniref:hypothetical protein n=1 Tax=Flagellimonas baculiformis TaxID=3067310 RepID=UPI00296F09E9|nr:hypothetical protein [Muricauda sp. D6]